MVAPKLLPPKKRQPLHLATQTVNVDNDDRRDVPSTPVSVPKKLAPYPSKQLFVLACCRFSEPVAMTSSFPYLFFMIRDFHLTDDEKKIGRYAGFLASSFSFAQFFSGTPSYTSILSIGLPWGRLSDSYGRKPMIICGLLGTVSATLVFGFSTSFTQALLARTGAGLLNGNVGVIRTMVAEMVVERAHQARAFSVMPVVWSLGSILGPILGGAYPPHFHN
jgi:MFS family permease